jgi:large subunit ribosomal protein L32
MWLYAVVCYNSKFQCRPYFYYNHKQGMLAMPVPKRKTSKSRRDKRSAGKRKVDYSSTKCVTCGAGMMQHTVCSSCGFYKGEKILRTKDERSKDREIRRIAKEKGTEQLAEEKVQVKNIAKQAAAKKITS